MVEIQTLKPGESGIDLTARRQRIITMKMKACVYGGVKYDSLSSLANKLGVSRTTISRALACGEYKGVKLEGLK